MPKAARLGDSIGHTPPGEGPQGGGGDVTGKIIGPCSGNVFTNGIKAARAFVDMTVCSLHPQAPLPIATGSSTVFINGLPAARVSDKIVCRAYITDGSANVFIGGAAVQTNSFIPEGIVEEVVELVENGATLVLGAGEIVVGGFYNSVVRIGAGLASIPYMLDSVDAAVGVQKEIAEGLNYNFRSDGAKQIGEALKPAGVYVQEKITVAKDFSEEHIGLGATAVVFGSAEAVVEIAGVVTGGKVVKSFVDFPLPGANRVAAGAESSSAAFDGALYPPDKLRQLVPYLEKRGVSVYGTNGNPRFDARWDGTGTMYLPENPTVLQVKHELSHYLDFRNSINSAGDVRSGVQSFVDMGRLGREEAVLSRLQNNRSWQQMNSAERDFSIEYVNRLKREAGQ